MSFLRFLQQSGKTRKRKTEQGAAMVELALSLSLLMLIVFGIIEFGRAVYTKNTLNNAARVGARYAALARPFLPMTTAISQIKALVPNQPGLAIVFTSSGATITSPPSSGFPILVTVTLPFQTVVPSIIPGLNNITIKGEAAMRYEN